MRFNIASLDHRKLLQALYEYASAKAVSPDEHKALAASGKTVKTLSPEQCNKIINQRTDSSCRVDFVQGKHLNIEWKRISDSLTVLDTAGYDLIHGQYRTLEALLASFDIRHIQIVDRHYEPSVWEQFKIMPKRSCADAFYMLLERAVLTTDEHHNPHWTLMTPLHQMAAALNR